MQRSTNQVKKIAFRHDRRGACSWILNFLWLLLGGWHMFLSWLIAGIILCFSCVGIPCGLQCFKISFFLLFPFGKSLAYSHETLEDGGGRCCMRSCNCVLNILWAITVGWILALQALITGVLLMVTVVGIPFGWQCFKLMYLCLCPFGTDFSADEIEVVAIETETTTTNYSAMEP